MANMAVSAIESFYKPLSYNPWIKIALLNIFTKILYIN
jgi:hypothetical protein